MARWWMVWVLSLTTLVVRGEDITEVPPDVTEAPVEEQPSEEVDTPRLMFQVIEGKGFNISIPNAGQVMTEFKYFVNFNQEFKDVTDTVFSRGRVECFNEKSRFKVAKNKELKEGDVLYFYLVGYKKPSNFQMERVYEVKKDSDGALEFYQKSERSGLEKDGLWYQLDKTKEITN